MHGAQISEREARRLALEFHCHEYLETSAALNEGVTALFDLAVGALALLYNQLCYVALREEVRVTSGADQSEEGHRS